MNDLRPDIAEHLRFFADLGVKGISRDSKWTARAADVVTPITSDDVSRPQAPTSSLRVGTAADVLAAIQIDIGPACSRCKLHALGRQRVVFGVGNPDADLMFVGEAQVATRTSRGFRSSAAPDSSSRR